MKNSWSTFLQELLHFWNYNIIGNKIHYITSSQKGCSRKWTPKWFIILSCLYHKNMKCSPTTYHQPTISKATRMMMTGHVLLMRHNSWHLWWSCTWLNLKDKILFGIVAILRSNLFALMVRLLKLFKTKDMSIYTVNIQNNVYRYTAFMYFALVIILKTLGCTLNR